MRERGGRESACMSVCVCERERGVEKERGGRGEGRGGREGE